MTTLDLKSDLHQLIDKISDSKVLNAVYTLLKNQPTDVVAYDSKGKPLTKKAYIKMIKDTEAEVAKGHYVTLEELEKEAKNW